MYKFVWQLLSIYICYVFIKQLIKILLIMDNQNKLNNRRKWTVGNTSYAASGYVNDLKDKKELGNVGEALDVLIDSHKIMNELGLNDERQIKRLKMIQDMLNKDGQNISLSNIMDRFITSAFKGATNVVEMDKSKVINNSSISLKGSARIRINHFIKQLKEHNEKSEHKIQISQAVIRFGISGQNKTSIDSSKILCTDKNILINGTGSNGGAIKRVFVDNGNFKGYNEGLGISNRVHNRMIIKYLESK